MIAEQIPQIEDLTSDEKLSLMGELWEQVSGEALEAETKPSPEMVAMLRERLDEYRRNPDAVSTWEEVKQRIRQRNAS